MTPGVDLLRDGLLRVEDETPRQETTLAESLPGPPSAELGPCVLCSVRTAATTCVQCERPVCREDVWVMLRLCRACLPEEEMRRARDPRLRARPDLGIKWIED